ncbi:hypothetical protein BCR41DRAFT_368655 [Lobosporangium transversale]|uniref:Uncharacterized protein n=1 Tax=Lobosporangium transversale TaxID=64571 RepID=A0A1Y2GUU4_9FUNG|nr:hypothetical protein BCR41DRAFT_368655 [Lobosporangium transversale]ORZ24829.1 hypothetical protein BCR41DRAFT_368655 [Lobosporangium transversale]|eukprot:XP_021883810.1 hypothetical protein BCR41DRAFT_368655 [Lobosporangium transversale]
MSMWTLITASMDSTLRIWDLRTLQCLRVFRSKHSLTCVSQSNAAGVVCARTSFGGLYIWDVKTGELILQDDAAMPQNASFMYMDEKYIGYGQCDGGVTVFDWSSRTSLEVVGSHHVHEGDRIGGTGKAFDQEKQNIPTRFPKPTSIYCLPRTYRQLEHGTTSARDSYGVFLLNNCTHLHEIAVYTRATKQVKQINGPAVDTILTNAMRGRFYTTMECNMHCAVVSSGNVVYVISFLPSDL